MTIEAMLNEREKRYGRFANHAAISQNLKAVMRETPGWNQLRNSQRESLEMIAHKIARILNGSPEYIDSIEDIAGYAMLIANELRGEVP